MTTTETKTPSPKRKKSEEDVAREKIPTLADLDTLYRPMGNLLMVIPLPNITQVKGLILPDAHQIILNEGHIVAMGPRCLPDQFQVGDCIIWDKHTETRFNSEGREFVLVNDTLVVMRISATVLQTEASGLSVV